MKQSQDTKGVDWKKAESEIEAASNTATKERLYAPLPEEHRAALEKLGISLPSAVRATSQALSTQAESLRELQERDGLQGLLARATHTGLVTKINGLIRNMLHDPKLPKGTKVEAVRSARDRKLEVDREYEQSLQKSPEAFMAAKVAEMRKSHRQYNGGRIIQTDYVREKMGEVLEGLGASRMCFIHGETGTGKTEVARIVAREFSGKEALVVRGYAGISASEFYGHMTLTDSTEKRIENARAEIDLAEKVYKEKFPSATPEDLRQVALAVLQKGGVSTTEYVLGSVYRAAKEGKVAIIDEANYVPPELLASLNDIMTKKPGEKINVQQDGVGPIEVQQGFGIIFTGNINSPTGAAAKRYVGRRDFDAAFEDRVPFVGYGRLPQTVQGRASDFSLADKQLFYVATISALLPPRAEMKGDTVEKLENRYGTLLLPGGLEKGLDELWRFAQFAAITQKAFQGEIGDGDAHGFLTGGNSTGYVPKVQLSNRGMMRVIEQWRDEGFQYELDHYIAQDLFRRAKDPNDRAYFYQMGQFMGFFQSSGWPQNPDYSSKAVQRFAIESPRNEAVSPDIVPAREVIEALYGVIPSRTEWPDGSETRAQADQNNAAELVSMEVALEKWEAEWRSLSSLTEVSGLVETPNEKWDEMKKKAARLGQ